MPGKRVLSQNLSKRAYRSQDDRVEKMRNIRNPAKYTTEEEESSETSDQSEPKKHTHWVWRISNCRE